jgi:uncharacterized protein YutE (UPF0331/DUF86 family)
MTLDPDVVRGRCSEIEESVARLEQLAAIPRDRFLSDRDTLDIACYRLLVAIEAALSLCYHVSSRRLRKIPEDYAACFGVLADATIIPPDLASRLQQMARFRNMLVHIYWKLDHGQVYDILSRNLDDLRDFSRTIAGLV